MGDDDAAIYDPLDEYITGKSHALIEACKDGDYEKLITILQKFHSEEKPLRLKDICGWQAIHHASKHANTACLSALLKLDDSLVHEKTHEGNTPLIIAAGVSNTDAVGQILPFLQPESVLVCNLHGLNALFYAVSCGATEGTQIALRLLEVDRSESHILCCSTFDTLPFQVIKNKNAELFSAMLDAGLDVSFNVSGDAYFCDDDFAVREYSPKTLLGYCVKVMWTEGMQMLVSTAKKRIAKRQSCSDITPLLCSLFDSPDTTCSAWSLIFILGYKEGLDMMLQEGILSSEMYPATVDRTTSMNFSSLPMVLVLTGNIWLKKDFIKYFLTMQSCDSFRLFYRKVILDDTERRCKDAKDEREKNHLLLLYFFEHHDHPLDEVIRSMSLVKDHSVEDSIDMLLECGFTFDFEYPIYYHHEVGWQNTVGRLLSYNNTIVHLDEVKVISCLLDRPLNLPITMDAIGKTCYLTGGHFTEHESSETTFLWPHLLLMQFLSKRPESEIKQVYERCLHLLSSQPTSDRFLNKPDYSIEDCLFDDCHWLAVIQVIIKGVHICLGDRSYLNMWKKCRNMLGFDEIPFSTYMLGDNDRNYFLEHGFDSFDDSFEESLRDLKLSSLQVLCRRVIRNQIGYRLIREPVPRRKSAPEVFDIDESWEVSVIDQLPVPKILQDYLRFKPEIWEYVSYRRRSLVRRTRSSE